MRARRWTAEKMDDTPQTLEEQRRAERQQEDYQPQFRKVNAEKAEERKEQRPSSSSHSRRVVRWTSLLLARLWGQARLRARCR